MLVRIRNWERYGLKSWIEAAKRRLHHNVSIAAPGDFAEDRAVSRRDLLGHQSEPGAEVAAFGGYVSGADRGHYGARNDRPDARHISREHA